MKEFDELDKILKRMLKQHQAYCDGDLIGGSDPVDQAKSAIIAWAISKAPEKDSLPLELQHCDMEIYRKSQNLTPLLNEVRNQCREQYIKNLKGER